MTSNDFKYAYDILHDIYVKGAYSTIAINERLAETRHKDRIVRIVYGVLDRDVELDYYIDYLCKTKPKTPAKIILKIALYCIIYMDSMPSYAVVDNAVELCKAVGKREYQGFINASLKRFISEDNIPLPKDERARLSVSLSKQNSSKHSKHSDSNLKRRSHSSMYMKYISTDWTPSSRRTSSTRRLSGSS